MKKIYCIKCNKYRIFKNPKILYIFDKTLTLSIIYKKCGSNDEIIYKEEKSIDILRLFGLTNILNELYMYWPNVNIITLKINMVKSDKIIRKYFN